MRMGACGASIIHPGLFPACLRSVAPCSLHGETGHPLHGPHAAVSFTISKILLPHISAASVAPRFRASASARASSRPTLAPGRAQSASQKVSIHISRKYAYPLHSASFLQACGVLVIKTLTWHLRSEFMKFVHTNTITYRNNKQSFNYVYTQIICTSS